MMFSIYNIPSTSGSQKVLQNNLFCICGASAAISMLQIGKINYKKLKSVQKPIY